MNRREIARMMTVIVLERQAGGIVGRLFVVPEASRWPWLFDMTMLTWIVQFAPVSDDSDGGE